MAPDPPLIGDGYLFPTTGGASETGIFNMSTGF